MVGTSPTMTTVTEIPGPTSQFAEPRCSVRYTASCSRAEDWMMRDKLESLLEGVLFASRWLLAPFYLGLAVGIVIVLIKFLEELYHIAGKAFSSTEADVIVGVLSLVDLA